MQTHTHILYIYIYVCVHISMCIEVHIFCAKPPIFPRNTPGAERHRPAATAALQCQAGTHQLQRCLARGGSGGMGWCLKMAGKSGWIFSQWLQEILWNHVFFNTQSWYIKEIYEINGSMDWLKGNFTGLSLSLIFDGKIDGFRLRCSLKPIHWMDLQGISRYLWCTVVFCSWCCLMIPFVVYSWILKNWRILKQGVPLRRYIPWELSLKTPGKRSERFKPGSWPLNMVVYLADFIL